jgi:TRAP-type C4-dicarboxylate transport system substrate-binding protein
MSKKVWDTMSPKEQQTLQSCAVKARADQRKSSREHAARSLTNLKAKGMQVNEISTAEMQRIRDRSKIIYERNAGAIGKDALEVVQAELEKIRKK